MWEKNARKLMLDLDMLRVELSDQSKKQADLNMELSAAHAERDVLKKEVERLKLLLEKLVVKQTAIEDLTSQDEDQPRVQKELKDELKFQKESNANLALQLKRSQESNIELVAVLQELEETIEKQKVELEDLLALRSEFSDMENTLQASVEENKKLAVQLQNLQESENNLTIKVQMLEKALEEKNQQSQDVGNWNSQSLLHIETEYKSKLFNKKEETVYLKAKLSESLNEWHYVEMESINAGDNNLIRQIEELKEKVEELEKDCNELTDENLDLLFKLKESKNNTRNEDTSIDIPCNGILSHSFTGFNSQVSKQKFQNQCSGEKLVKEVHDEATNHDNRSIQVLETLNMDLETKLREMGKKLSEGNSEIERLQTNILTKDNEILVLRQCRSELEAKVSSLQKEKSHLREHMEDVCRESDVTSKCLNELRHDLVFLRSSVDSHISANQVLEKKCSELETANQKLELHVLELEEENVQLSVHVSGMEAELRHLTQEKDSSTVKLDNFKTQSLTLQDEVNRLTTELEMRHKLQDIENQWAETQEECEYLRRENIKLQATAESVMKECSHLQKSNGGLRKQKLELHEQCSMLETKLNDSHKRLAECSKKVEDLEETLSSMAADIASKERSLTSRLEAVLDENLRYKEKFKLEESSLNQMYMEKAIEVQNLQQEVECLRKNLSATHKERERIASDAVQEASRLLADNTKLQNDYQEFQSKFKQMEIELNAVKLESEVKLQNLIIELDASKQKEQLLMADHEKLSKSLEDYKSVDEKYKANVNSLEVKLSVSEYERQHLVEESSNLKVQLQNLTILQDELLASTKLLHATKFEKEKLEALMHSITEECEDLKAEKNTFVEKIGILKNTMAELENCKHEKLALEEKLLQMEGELGEMDVLRSQVIELRNELDQIKKTNNQFQQKIQRLKEERDECLRRSQTLEEEFKLIKEEKQNHKEHGSPKVTSFSKNNSKVIPVREDMKLSKVLVFLTFIFIANIDDKFVIVLIMSHFLQNEMVKNSTHRRDNRRNAILKNGQVQDPSRAQTLREVRHLKIQPRHAFIADVE